MAATIKVSTIINGEPQSASITRDEDGALQLKPQIAAGKAASNWTKLDAQTGSAQLAVGQSILAGEKVAVFGPAGRRHGMVAWTNDYLLQADVTFLNTTTELGFGGRLNTAEQTGYVLSLNAHDSYFNLIKLDPAEQGGFVNLVNHHVSGLSFTPEDSYRITFSVVGSTLRGELRSAAGELLDSIEWTDEAYATGGIGTWAWRAQAEGSLAGRWDNLALGEIAFPPLSAYPQEPATFEQSEDGRSLQVEDPSGQFPLVAGVIPLDVADRHIRVCDGAGDELPAGETPVVVCKEIDLNASFDPDDMIVLLVSSDRRASVVFRDAGDEVLLALDLAAGGFSLWFSGSGLTRPMTGSPVAKITVANGDESAGTVKISTIYDPTP